MTGSASRSALLIPLLLLLPLDLPKVVAAERPERASPAPHIVDLYPTFLRLAGIRLEQEKPLDGRDAWPVFTKGERSPHDFILHNVTPWSGALRMGKWKLLHNGNTPANATEGPGKETWELFDMDADPNEKTDLSNRHPEVFAKLCARLQSLREEAVPASIPPNAAPAGFESPKVWGAPASR